MKTTTIIWMGKDAPLLRVGLRFHEGASQRRPVSGINPADTAIASTGRMQLKGHEQSCTGDTACFALPAVAM